MPVVNLRGVDVCFPFQPYECQEEYMRKVLECLQEGRNGVLESPTGTGKTLSLLCATLAWREAYRANLQLKHKLTAGVEETEFGADLTEQLNKAANWGNDEQKQQGFFDVPRIIYASRTHSQLSQAVQELKRTAYKVKVAVIGSREQLCINSDVLKQDTNSGKVHMCRAKVQSRTCHAYNNLENNKTNPEFSQEMLDIEDLMLLGNKHSVCPYYMARELKSTADIIFMPYNYLLDMKARNAHNIDINGCVILFDEAHNLERTCEDSASFDLTSFDIASCVEDVDACIEFKQNSEEASFGDESNSVDVDMSELVIFKAMFLQLEEEIAKLQITKKDEGSTYSGKFVYELLGKLKITFESKTQILELLDKCNALLAADNGKAFRGKHFALSKFADALNIIFNQDTPPNNFHDLGKDYKVHVHAEETSKKQLQKLDVWTTNTNAVKEGRTLSYWCFSPGYTMKELVRAGVRSMILTSGTLSPLQSFTTELKISIPVTLENPHVIEKHQFWVGLVTKGPDGETLNSSYNNRFQPRYMDSLGNTIVNFSRIIPNGLLVFFPSYPVMNKLLEYWQSTGVWNRIANNKPLFVEPRGKTLFIETMEQFYEKINDPAYNCAVFFAVCRGKVSEGLDFADMNGRAVIITGLPFPPMMDPKIKLKMKFLDENKKKDAKGLTGQQWYRQQATRAVNQAIGRVIRHKSDFGAILLCDVRFTYPDAVAQLPSWVRPYVKRYDTFGLAQRDISQFFRHMEKIVDISSIVMKQQRAPLASKQKENSAKLKTASGSTQSNVQKSSASQGPARTVAVLMQRKKDSARSKPTAALSKLKIEYEKAAPQSVQCAGLLDSLSVSESIQESKLIHPDEVDTGKTSLSDRIMKNKPSTENSTASKQKKVLKVVRKKEDLEPSSTQSGSKSVIPAQKLAEAKQYIIRMRSILDEEQFKTFSRILRDYKKTNDFDNLMKALTPLLGMREATFPLLLDFDTFVKDLKERKKFYAVYEDITGKSVPSELWASVGVNKRYGSDSSDSDKQLPKKTRIE